MLVSNELHFPWKEYAKNANLAALIYYCTLVRMYEQMFIKYGNMWR